MCANLGLCLCALIWDSAPKFEALSVCPNLGVSFDNVNTEITSQSTYIPMQVYSESHRLSSDRIRRVEDHSGLRIDQLVAVNTVEQKGKPAIGKVLKVSEMGVVQWIKRGYSSSRKPWKL